MAHLGETLAKRVDVFDELVMLDHRVTPTALIMPSSEAVWDYVAAHDGAIGYLSLG